jgi:hypothetical protein
VIRKEGVGWSEIKSPHILHVLNVGRLLIAIALTLKREISVLYQLLVWLHCRLRHTGKEEINYATGNQKPSTQTIISRSFTDPLLLISLYG